MFSFLFLPTSSPEKDKTLEPLQSGDGPQSSGEMQVDTDAHMDIDENEVSTEHVSNVREIHFSPKITRGSMNNKLMGEIHEW